MPIPISYSYRNLLAAAHDSTFLTAVGMAGNLLSLPRARRRPRACARPGVDLVFDTPWCSGRSETEVQGAIDRTQAAIIAPSGRSPTVWMPLVAAEAIILVNLTKAGQRQTGETLSSCGAAAFRPAPGSAPGPSPGSGGFTNEIVAGAQIRRGAFRGPGWERRCASAMRDWRVVGGL